MAGRRFGEQRLAAPDWRLSAVVAASTFAAVAALVAILEGLGLDFGLAARDPLAVAVAGDDVFARYVGWVSHLGVLAWALATVAPLVAGRLALARGEQAPARFFLASAALSGALLLDDLFMLHENVVPALLGVPTDALLLLWAALAAAWAVRFHRRLLADPALPVLGVAGAWFALSVLAELLDAGPVAEEGAKLVGVLCWASFHWSAAIRSASP